MSSNAYEGASRSFRLAHKGLLDGSPDSLAARELRFLRARSQHLLRNSGPARTAQMRSVSNWVGTGIKVLFTDKRVQKLWDEFAKNPALDVSGTLGNVQALWGNSLVSDGEALSRMVIKRRPGMTVPLALQTFDTAQLDPMYSEPTGVRHGIKFDKFNTPEAYMFWQRHPSSFPYIYTQGQMQNKRVAVPADDVLHLFEQLRPGQWRGVPAFAPILTTLYEMEELNDAVLVRTKAAQAIAWIVELDQAGPAPAFGGIASSQREPEVGQETADEDRVQIVTPGAIHYFRNGEKVTSPSIPDIGDNFTSLLKQYWRTIAASLGLTYEQMTGDLSDVNFSSIRAGLIEFRKRLLQVQHLIFVNQGLEPLVLRFVAVANTLGTQNYSTEHRYVLPKLSEVDRYKDVMADILETSAGFSTLEEQLLAREKDFDATVKQLMEEHKLDIILESNYTHKKKSGESSSDAKATSSKEDTEESKEAEETE